MTPNEIAHLRADFLAFTEYMFQARKGVPMMRAKHQDLICTALEKVVVGKTKRLIINIPPRSGKTELAVISFIAWCMGNWPHSQFIHASYSKRLATSNAYAVRSIMQHEAYGAVFGGVGLADDSKAKDEFRTDHGGLVYATGADGSITGVGAGAMGDSFGGAIVIDDPHKAGEALSDVMRANVIDWFGTTMESRKNSPDTPIIVIMQRLHESDLTGFLIGGGNGEKWEVLKVPAMDDHGASFWPAQFPVDMLERLERTNPYVYAGQYMQEPSPRAGGDFKPDNIEIIDALPAGLKFVRGWDLAATVKKTSDYTATTKLAVLDGITYIAHGYRFKGGPDEVERSIVQFAETDTHTEASLPQDPGQAGVAQKQNISKKLQGRRFEFSPETGDKRTRALPLAAQVNVGNVKMLRGDWNNDMLHEMRMFPNGKNDDYVDSASRAYNRAALTKKTVGVILPTRR